MNASDRKGRFPGHLRAIGGLRVAGMALLLTHYDGYEPFLNAAADAHSKRQQLLTINSPSDRRNALRTLNHGFAARWNLHRIAALHEHDYRAVDTAIAQTGTVIKGEKGRRWIGRPFYPASLGGAIAPPEDPTVEFAGRRWPWHLGRAESLAEVREQIRGDLGLPPRARLPAALLEELRALPARAEALGWRLADTRSTLTQQIQWLFWRLCPQPDLPYRWEAITEAHDARRPVAASDASTVARTVRRLARHLQIELPRVRGRALGNDWTSRN